MTLSPADTLHIIQNRLDRSIPVPRIIEELLPFTHADAMTWARRLPFWDEFRGQHSGQAVALARVVSKRTMREFSLKFGEDGRVVEDKPPQARSSDKPTKTFTMPIGDETVEVRYTEFCLPHCGDDNFYFLGAELPLPIDPSSEMFRGRKAHPLSATGYWSQYVPHDAVEACGGPERCAALLAEAKVRGEDNKFEAVFKGEWPSRKPSQRRPPRRRTLAAGDSGPPLVMGEHTAAVVEERQEEPKTPGPMPRQKELFS